MRLVRISDLSEKERKKALEEQQARLEANRQASEQQRQNANDRFNEMINKQKQDREKEKSKVLDSSNNRYVQNLWTQVENKANNSIIDTNNNNSILFKDKLTNNINKNSKSILDIQKENSSNITEDTIKSLAEMDRTQRLNQIKVLIKDKDEQSKLNLRVEEYLQNKKSTEEAEKINKDMQEGSYWSAVGHVLKGVPEEALNSTINTAVAMESLVPVQRVSNAPNPERHVDAAKILTNKYQNTTSQIDNKGVQIASGVSGTIGQMVPSILANFMAPGTQVGNLVQAVNVASSGYLENLNENQDNKLKSLATGTLKGLASYGIERLTGGNFLGSGSLDDIAKKTIKSNVSSNIGRRIASKIYEVGGETLEENLENQVGYVIDKVINNKDMTTEQWLNDLGQTSRDTVLTTVVLNLLGLGGNTYKEIQNDENIDNNTKEIIKKTEKIIKDENLSVDNINQANNVKVSNAQEEINNNQAINRNISSMNFEESARAYNIDANNETVKTVNQVLSNRDITGRFDENYFKNNNENAIWRTYTDEQGNTKREVIFNPNGNTQDTMQQISVHELTHDLSGTKEFDELKSLVLDRNKTIQGYTEARQSLENTYSQVYNPNSKEFKNLVDEEEVADTLAQKLGDQEFVNSLSTEKPTVFKKIYDWVVDKVNKITGNKIEKVYWEDIRNKFENAYRQTYQGESNQTRYSFVGEKGLNNAIMQEPGTYMTAEQGLNRAKQMQKTGTDNENIRQNTGWFQDRNGDWKFEISDKNMKIKDNIQLKENTNYKLGDIIEHNTLFTMYPNFKNIDINFKDLKNVNGFYDKKQKSITINNKIINSGINLEKTIIHELQHSIQNEEGFENGTTSRLSRKRYYENLGEIEASDTAQRFLKEKYENSSNSTAPESSKANPKHKNYDRYMQKRGVVDKIKDNMFKSNKKGDKSYETFEENISENQIKDKNLVAGRERGRYLNETNQESLEQINKETLQDNDQQIWDGLNVPIKKLTDKQRQNRLEYLRNVDTSNMKFLEKYQIKSEIRALENGYNSVEEMRKAEKESRQETANNNDIILQREAIANKLKDKGANVDKDGNVTLYHITTIDNYNQIKKDGYFKPNDSPIGGMTGEEVGLRSFFSYDKSWVETWRQSANSKVIEIKVPAEYIRQGAKNEKEIYIEGILKRRDNGIWTTDKLPTSTFYDRIAVKEYQKQKTLKSAEKESENNSDSFNLFKEQQLDIIQKTNPMLDDIHTGIRTVDDIKTFKEAYETAKKEANDGGWKEYASYPDITNDMIENSLKTGEITVYSSNDIKNGTFVTPSYEQALEYAGNDTSKVKSKNVKVEDVAWINLDEGQYAKVVENNNQSKLSMQQSSVWQDFLNTQIGKRGKGKTVQELKLPTKETINSKKTDVYNVLYQNEEQTNTMNLPVSEGGKIRKHYKTIMQSPNTSPEARAIAQELIGADTYVPDSNERQLKIADERIERNGADNEAISLATKVKNGDRITAEDVATGERLIEYYSKVGDKEKLQDSIQNVALAGTQLGQAVQAMSLVNRQTPQGQAVYLQKVVDKMNSEIDRRTKGKGKKFELTPEMIEKITNSSKENLEQNIDEVARELANQVPKTTIEKIDSWRYFSMLANPRTHFRNIIGNFSMAGVQSIKNKVAGGLEAVAQKTGMIDKRTKTLKPANKQTRDFAKADVDNVMARLNNESKFDARNLIQQYQRTFKNNALENTLGKLYNLNSKALEKEDVFGLKRGYRKALADYMTANKLTKEYLTSGTREADIQLEKARKYAIEQAQEATFHQQSAMASMLAQFEKKNTATRLITGAVIPFKKTPINVAKSGASYSPLGLVKSFTLDVVNLKNGKITANQYIDNLAKGLTGTGIATVGYALAQAGILSASGGDDDQKNEYYKEDRGNQAFSIKIGDKTYSLDWLAPTAIPLFIGAELNYNIKNSNEEQTPEDILDRVSNSIDAMSSAMNPMIEMSMLSGLASTIKSFSQGDTQVFQNLAINAGKSYINQFFPTLGGQIARIVDDTERSSTSTKKNAFAKAVDSTGKQILNKIPFASKLLPAKTDVWGNTLKRDSNPLYRTLQQIAFPWSEKELKSTSVDNAISDLYEETGEKSVLPNTSINKDFTLNGEKYRLTAEEYAEYKKNYGKNSYELLNNLTSSKEYKNMNNEQKTEAISKIYEYANEKNKVDYANKNKVDIETSSLYNTVTSIEKEGGSGSDYFKYLGQIKGIEKTEEKIKILESTDIPEKSKSSIYENTIGKSDDFYSTVLKESNININEYLKYKQQKFESDKKDDGTLEGKTITNSKKQKVYNYVNNMNISYNQKLLILGKQYKLKDNEQKKLYEYINNLPGQTSQEKLEIFKMYTNNFQIYKNGTMSFK